MEQIKLKYMEIKKTLLCASMQVLNRQSLQYEYSLDLGIFDRPSQCESIRSRISENNPDKIFLVEYKEIVNPEYSPLTTSLNEFDK